MAELTAFTPTTRDEFAQLARDHKQDFDLLRSQGQWTTKWSHGMAGTLIANRALMERMRDAVQRYSLNELDDPAPIIDIFPEAETGKFVIVIASPQFKRIPYTARLKSVLNFLFSDPATSKEDLLEISRVMPESE